MLFLELSAFFIIFLFKFEPVVLSVIRPGLVFGNVLLDVPGFVRAIKFLLFADQHSFIKRNTHVSQLPVEVHLSFVTVNILSFLD